MVNKKTLKTVKESSTGRNIKSIDLKNLTKLQNEALIKKAEKNNLPGYHAVQPKKGKKFLKSNPDRKKKNNLDPKIKL